MKLVNYKVTGTFGFSKVGELRSCFLLAQDDDTGVVLLYHPFNKDTCASIEFGILRGQEYVSLPRNEHKNAFINLERKNLESLARSFDVLKQYAL